jgi:hypothetical protein
MTTATDMGLSQFRTLARAKRDARASARAKARAMSSRALAKRDGVAIEAACIARTAIVKRGRRERDAARDVSYWTNRVKKTVAQEPNEWLYEERSVSTTLRHPE